MKRKTACVFSVSSIALCLNLAAVELDRSVMSQAYWDVWNDGLQGRIDADIERYRQTDATLEVAAPDGAEVKVEQIDHAFFFGAHTFNFNQLGKKEWNDRYKALWGTLFNSGTVAFYWRTLEPRPGELRFEETARDTEEFWNVSKEPWNEPHWRRPPPEPIIEFLKERGLRIHGHPLVWGNNKWMTPNWLWDEFCPEAEKAALEKASGVKVPRWDASLPAGIPCGSIEKEWVRVWKEIYATLGEEKIAELVPTYLKAQNEWYARRVREIGERYGDCVDSWDVVNESAKDYDIFGRKAVRNCQFDASWYGPMPADYAYKAFTWAQKSLPARARLNINDYTLGEGMVHQVEDLAAHGAKIDVVGMQMHLMNPKESAKIARGEFSKVAYDRAHPDSIRKRFELYSRLARPVHLSEITITAPDNSTTGQMVQAIILRNLYRLWFSMEKIEGITWWNVVDNCGAPGEPSISGIFTRDMQPKTAYFAMDDLINGEWKTRLTVKAHEGNVSFRGFRGRYRLKWIDADGNNQSKTVELK